VLLHITSLPSPYGIGDLGPAAVAWVDRLHETGQTWWQALPLGPTGYGDSPYQALSSFAGNPLLISPDWLIEDELVKPREVAAGPFPVAAVDFEAVKRFKQALHERAWKSFGAGARSDLRPAFEHFSREQAHWLDDYALFRALKTRYDDAAYLDWPDDVVQRAPAALDQARREMQDEIDRIRFGQFLLLRQGERLKAHARARGVRLIGDLPFFVSPDSSDVWANPELFLLDAQSATACHRGGAAGLLQRAGTAVGQSGLRLERPRRTRLRLVHRPLARLARPRRRRPPRSLPRVRGGVAYSGGRPDGAVR
jgi:4-alpha-glucanotransferase